MPLIDLYALEQVIGALRAIKPSAKAESLVRAIATAPNRTMSRIELSRVIGSENVNACNATFGTYARNLISTLDPSLHGQLKEDGGDWVMCIAHALPRQKAPSENERDDWVFVLSETLARALDAVGFAPYQSLAEEVVAQITENEGVGDFDGMNDLDAWIDDLGTDPFTPPNPLGEIEAVEEELADLGPTVREAVILARVGQGPFRKRLLEVWEGRCAVTGATLLPVLVASHIKPWMVSSNEERLDPANGLMLVGTLDRLFDTGLITFEDSGAMRISPLVPESDYPALGLIPNLRLRNVPEASLPYLAVHRADFFMTDWEQK